MPMSPGGDPRRIPDLSYEQFVEFHRSHYHPSNSTIFFYGDADLDAELAFVQERFLEKFTQPVEKAAHSGREGGVRAVVRYRTVIQFSRAARPANGPFSPSAR